MSTSNKQLRAMFVSLPTTLPLNDGVVSIGGMGGDLFNLERTLHHRLFKIINSCACDELYKPWINLDLRICHAIQNR